MSFKAGLTLYMQRNLRCWDIKNDDEGNILIVVEDSKSLKRAYESIKSILWLAIPEIPCKAVKVKIVMNHSSGSIRYAYVFNPG